MSYNSKILSPSYDEYKQNEFRGQTSISHDLLEEERKNATVNITSYLQKTILNQSKFNRYRYIYNLSAEKCFNNNSNNYTFSESQQCERLLFDKDPVLNNIKNFTSHVEVMLENDYERSLKGLTCSRKYLNAHKEYLLRTNFLYRYYFYFMAKSLFTSN